MLFEKIGLFFRGKGLFCGENIGGKGGNELFFGHEADGVMKYCIAVQIS